ncbi:LacI family DNA-binding transcriptional regulator [Cognatishimia sp. F0-27]|uniref:LacI family DNA-binding transcriptional regulator n=1 Tax=Cognatishimia sp. F0-27 TaxID=2816855 RepID=UPI001D0CB0DC|nr:LacI family DNA-binding transcriptional regulator [Cognatishimia sp. F0-27]MCC1492910.1 LacI family DNA-binding transcriptional regulator [Cognatishimia sp. F0-27]
MTRDSTAGGLTNRPKRKPTLRTIAQMTGFAVATVSRALADDPRIAAKTRATVAEAARAVGYVPDRAARRLRTGRTQVVTLMLNTEHEFLGFTHEFLSGITAGLAGTGYSVTVVPDALGADRLDPVRTILRNRLADGLIFTRTESFDPRARLLMEADFPFVSHGRTEFTEPHPWVDFDNESFARAAVERHVQRGRERIAFVPPSDKFTFAQHLRYGFLSAVRAAGVGYEIADTVTIDSPSAVVADWVRARTTAPEPPDAWVCVGEATALVTLGALSDCGVLPGRDVDVISKRASPIFDNIRPRIETVFEDVRLTGKTMAKMLVRRMQGEDPAMLHHLFSAEPDFALEP